MPRAWRSRELAGCRVAPSELNGAVHVVRRVTSHHDSSDPGRLRRRGESTQSKPGEYNKLLLGERHLANHFYRQFMKERLKDSPNIPEMNEDKASFLGWYYGTFWFGAICILILGVPYFLFMFTRGLEKTIGRSICWALWIALLVLLIVRRKQNKKMHPSFRRYIPGRNYWE